MSREDAIVLASRTLALFLTVWVLSDLCYVPERVYSLLRYSVQGVRAFTRKRLLVPLLCHLAGHSDRQDRGPLAHGEVALQGRPRGHQASPAS